jgi:hypothetical protein
MGNTKEEEKEYLKRYFDDHSIPFIPVKDPEKKLRELDFDFRYPPDVMSIQDIREDTLYNVVGLKKAETQKEKIEAELSPATVDHWYYLPLLRKVVQESMK